MELALTPTGDAGAKYAKTVTRLNARGISNMNGLAGEMVTVEIEKIGRGDRIALRFPYSPEGVARAKSVSGARWSNDQKLWHYAVTMTNCKLLREQFPALIIGPNLSAWARAEIAIGKTLNDFHVATSAEPIELELVPMLAPTMWAAMQERGYQTVVPAFAKAVGNYFNASQPGVGKSIETLATLIECEVGDMVLVVAPKKAIQATWPREIEKWLAADMEINVNLVDEEFGTIPEREAHLEDIAEAAPVSGQFARFNFVLINPEMLRWTFTCDDPGCDGKRKSCGVRASHNKYPQHPSLFAIKWDAIILDETHRMMMNANERSTSVSGWGYGAQKLRVKENGIKIGLSGTPFKGKPRRFWPVLHWLHPETYSGQWKWTEQYFAMEADRWSASGKKVTDSMRPEREHLFNDDLSRIMIRHTKRELRAINPNWSPPEKVHVDVVIPMDSKQAKAYKSMQSDSSARLDDGTIMANGILAEMTRLKQFASAYGSVKSGFAPTLPSNKWEWILDALEERGIAKGMNDGQIKVVIASQFVSLLNVFSAELDRLGINYSMISGSTKDVSAIENEWQGDQTDTRVMLLSTMAGGVSLTLDAADDLILVDETFVPDDQEQVEDRVHRTSRTDHQVTIYHLRSANTIDEIIAADNLLSDLTQKSVLDDRRGIAYLRLVLSGGGGDNALAV